MGLCWVQEDNSERRLDFPSWSWTSWAGTVSDWLLESQFWPAVKDVSIETRHGLVIGTDDYFQQCPEIRPPITHGIYFTALVIPIVVAKADGNSGLPQLWAYFKRHDGRQMRMKIGNSPPLRHITHQQVYLGLLLGLAERGYNICVMLLLTGRGLFSERAALLRSKNKMWIKTDTESWTRIVDEDWRRKSPKKYEWEEYDCFHFTRMPVIRGEDGKWHKNRSVDSEKEIINVMGSEIKLEKRKICLR